MSAEELRFFQIAEQQCITPKRPQFTTMITMYKARLASGHADLLRRTKQVTEQLYRWSADEDLILAAWLLPLLTLSSPAREEPAGEPAASGDTQIVEEIRRRFDPAIVELALRAHELRMLGMAEPGVKETHQPSVPRMERLATFYKAAYKNFRVVLLCLADQSAWANECDTLDLNTQHCWAEITNDIFIPLYELCGLWADRKVLANACVRYLADARELKALESAVRSYPQRHKEVFSRLARSLRTLFSGAGIAATITLREPTLGGLYQRAQRARQFGTPLNIPKDMAIMRVDILASGAQRSFSGVGHTLGGDLQECYAIMGALRTFGQPITVQGPTNTQFRDYIKEPRYNGYRALVTTIAWTDPTAPVGENRRVVEFRVRTDKMNLLNTRGIVAATMTKRPFETPANTWWKDTTARNIILERQRASQAGRVYVFCPNGEICDLPRGSTALDYAFKVHSSLGVYAQGFRLDGREVAKSEPLYNGALVEIEFDRAFSAVEADWRECVTSSTAKDVIDHWLKQREAPHERGRALIDQALKRELDAHNLRIPADELEQAIAAVAAQLGRSDLKRLYREIQKAVIAPDQIATGVIEGRLTGAISLAKGEHWPAARIHIARCCLNSKLWLTKHGDKVHVIPGEPIVGYMEGASDHRRLIVHHPRCEQAPGDAAKREPLTWFGLSEVRQALQISLIGRDSAFLLRTILDRVYDYYAPARGDVYLRLVTAKALEDSSVEIDLIVDAPQLEMLQPLRNDFEQMKRDGVVHSVDFWRFLSGQRILLNTHGQRATFNPYTLLAISSPAMFFGRDEELRSLTAALQNHDPVVVMVGQTRVGKSSLLRQLQRAVASSMPDVIPVLFDAQGRRMKRTSLLQELGEAVISAVRATPTARGATIHIPPMNLRTLARGRFQEFHRWLENICEHRLQGRRLVFLIDEFTQIDDAWRKGELEHDFYTGLRWLVDNTRHAQFVLTVHDTVYDRAQTPQESTGISIVLRMAPSTVTLQPLDDDAARKLICQPAGDIYHDDVIDAVIDLSGRYPYFLHLFCQKLIERLTATMRQRATIADLDAVVGQLITDRAADQYFWKLLEVTDANPTYERALTALALATEANRRAGCGWATANDVVCWAQELSARLKYPEWSVYEIEQLLATLAATGVVEQRETNSGVESRIPIGLYEKRLLKHTSARQDTRRLQDSHFD